MRIIDSGIVNPTRPRTDGMSSCFPAICVLESGRWLASFRLGPAKASRAQRAYITWSDDQGKTWSPPREVGGKGEINGRQCTWRTLSCTPLGGKRVAAVMCGEDPIDPLLPIFNETTEGLIDMKLFSAFSEDAGESFSAPKPVDCGKYRAVPTPSTGPLMVMPDGRWAVPFEVNKHYNDTTPWQHSSAITFSSDKGATWTGGVVDVYADPKKRLFCWDQRLAVIGDLVVDVFWTFDREAAKYLNIHQRISRDSGKTWGELTDTGVPGQPARIAAIDGKRWVMAYVDRTAAPVIKARLSSDGGATWPSETELVIHEPALRNQTWDKGTMQDAWAEMGEFSLGLPDAVPLPGGDVLTVFYSGKHCDHTDVRWARLRP